LSHNRLQWGSPSPYGNVRPPLQAILTQNLALFDSAQLPFLGLRENKGPSSDAKNGE
jgi:hypothetical protein